MIALLLPALAMAAPLLPVAPRAKGPPVRWTAAPLQLTLTPGEECAIGLDLPFTVLESGWVALPVVGPELVLNGARLDGRAVRLAGHTDGLALVARLPEGDHRLELQGTVACAGDRLQLQTPLAGPVRLGVEGPARSWTVQSGVHTGPTTWDLPPSRVVTAAWAPPRAPSPRPRVLRHDNVVALRVDEAGIEGRALLRQTVAHGTQDRITLTIPGGVEQAVATGPGVVDTEVRGDQITVRLREPVEGAVEVDLGWRAPAPDEEGAPAPVPQATAGRGRTAVVLVQGDDSVLLPEPGPGLEAVPMRRVGRRARGLVPGEPLVTYLSEEGRAPTLRLRQLRFSAVDQPPTVIDDAQYTVMYAEHGRAWMRASWQVRNDRNPFLRVEVPDGWQVFGLRVAGTTAEPVRAEDGALLVPLEKSVETLEGLVAFPVELMLVGEDQPWAQRGRRALQTPTVDAPIAMARWELRLPDGLAPKEAEGRGTVVSAWTPSDTGLLIGRGAKRPAPEDARRGAQQGQLSQEYWNQAYSAYKDNDFDKADVLLQKSLEANPDNFSAQSLMGNVDVLKNRAQLDEDAQLAANRVRAMAKARSGDTELAQAEKEVQLERALRSGNEEEAVRVADELLQLTETLAAVEQQEAVEQKARLSGYRDTVSQLGKKKAKKKEESRREPSSGKASSSLSIVRAPPPPPPPPPAASPAPVTRSVEIDFEGVDVSGELVKPEGALLLDRKRADFSPLIRTPDLAGKISDTSEVDGRFAADVAMSEPEPMPEPEEQAMPEAPMASWPVAQEKLLKEEILMADDAGGGDSLDGDFGYIEGEVVGGVEGGVVGGVVGGVLGGAVAFGAGVAAESDDEEERSDDDWSDDGNMPSPETTVVLESSEIVVLQKSKPFLNRLPSGRSYQEAVELVPATGTSRDSAPTTVFQRFGGEMAPVDRPAKARFPTQPGPAPRFPEGASAAAAHPVAPAVLRGPPVKPGPEHPPVRSPTVQPDPVRAAPPAPPVRGAAAPALPRRPAPPPAAAFGLDIPKKIVASTLSLSLPEGGARLLLEQRVIPSGEPLKVELRYRPSRR